MTHDQMLEEAIRLLIAVSDATDKMVAVQVSSLIDGQRYVHISQGIDRDIRWIEAEREAA